MFRIGEGKAIQFNLNKSQRAVFLINLIDGQIAFSDVPFLKVFLLLERVETFEEFIMCHYDYLQAKIRVANVKFSTLNRIATY